MICLSRTKLAQIDQPHNELHMGQQHTKYALSGSVSIGEDQRQLQPQRESKQALRYQIATYVHDISPGCRCARLDSFMETQAGRCVYVRMAVHACNKDFNKAEYVTGNE